MKTRFDQRGYILAIAILVLLVVSITSFALFNTFYQDTKHQVRVVQYDENYFLAEGAKEIAQYYYQSTVPHKHDGQTANDPAPLRFNFDGIMMTVKVQDAFQEE